MIPKKIFQTWKTKNLSMFINKLVESWKKTNPNYQHYLFDDNDCLDFLKTFDKKIYHSYQMIIPTAFKADLWRACVLYEYGGFYADIDTKCLNTIDKFINEQINFICPIDLNINCKTKHNLFNSFIGVNPKSKIMESCIEIICQNIHKKNKFLSVLDFSSCGVLGISVNRYLGLEDRTSFIGKEGVNGAIHLLKFDEKSEIISDLQKNNLFLNKNGDIFLSESYKKELNNLNIKHYNLENKHALYKTYI